MQFQFDLASANPQQPAASPQPTSNETVADLLRQMMEQQRDQFNQLMELQKEHLNHVRAQAQDAISRWRNLLSRWQKDQPEFGEHCKKAYPAMEKIYVQLLVNLVEELSQQEDDAMDSEFAIQEFIDRYGMRIGQLSHLLSIVGPLSEAANQNETNKQA